MKAVILTEEQAKRVRECLDTFGEGEGHALDAIALLTIALLATWILYLIYRKPRQ